MSSAPLIPVAYVQVQVSEERKDQWEEFADSNPEVTSLSSLVRRSVERFISEQEGETSDVTGQLLKEMDDFETQLSNIDDKLKLLRLERVEEDELHTLVVSATEEAIEMTEDVTDHDPRI